MKLFNIVISLVMISIKSTTSSGIATACFRSIPPDYLKTSRAFSKVPISPWEHCLSKQDMEKAGEIWERNWSRMLDLWDSAILRQTNPMNFSNDVLRRDQLVSVTEGGEIYKIVKDFGSRKSSHVYIGSTGSSRRVFKYETNCPQIRVNRQCGGNCRESSIVNEEPLVTEYVISKIVCDDDNDSEFFICPKIYALSPPELISENMDSRLQFTVIKPMIGAPSCLRNNSTYRYIEEELVGQSIDKMFSNKHQVMMPEINRAIMSIRIFSKIIDLLAILHDQGFIHGDIHVGNIVSRFENNTNSDELVLIDFGLSKFFPVEIGTNHIVDPNIYSGLSLALLSRYQLSSYRVSRRDDIYRAFEVFMTLLTNFEYTKIFGNHGQFAITIKTNPQQYNVLDGFENYGGIQFLKIFAHENEIDRFSVGDNNFIDCIDWIRTYVSEQITIDERPNYIEIKKKLQIIESILLPYYQVDLLVLADDDHESSAMSDDYSLSDDDDDSSSTLIIESSSAESD